MSTLVRLRWAACVPPVLGPRMQLMWRPRMPRRPACRGHHPRLVLHICHGRGAALILDPLWDGSWAKTPEEETPFGQLCASSACEFSVPVYIRSWIRFLPAWILNRPECVECGLWSSVPGPRLVRSLVVLLPTVVAVALMSAQYVFESLDEWRWARAWRLIQRLYSDKAPVTGDTQRAPRITEFWGLDTRSSRLNPSHPIRIRSYGIGDSVEATRLRVWALVRANSPL